MQTSDNVCVGLIIVHASIGYLRTVRRMSKFKVCACFTNSIKTQFVETFEISTHIHAFVALIQ